MIKHYKKESGEKISFFKKNLMHYQCSFIQSCIFFNGFFLFIGSQFAKIVKQDLENLASCKFIFSLF